MHDEEMTAFDCPCCRGELFRPLAWYRQPHMSCPRCGAALNAADFAAVLLALEETMEERIEEVVQGGGGTGCCGGHRD